MFLYRIKNVDLVLFNFIISLLLKWDKGKSFNVLVFREYLNYNMTYWEDTYISIGEGNRKLSEQTIFPGYY